MNIDSRVEERLSAALGIDAVRRSEEGNAVAVVSPADSAEVVEALAICRETRTPVVPLGGGTHMEVGGPPPPGSVYLSTARLGQLVEHDDANLTVTVGAGATVAALQTMLAPRGQFVALDSPDPTLATIGGVVATNLNGYRRIGYRSIRDLVIGMRVITGTGETIKAGGKVVKNVAGYDMCKLFVGSHGTLGIITEVTARLEPRPEADVTLLAEGLDGTEALRLAETLAASPLLPTALAVLSPRAATSEAGAQGHAVLMRAEGFAPAVERQAQDVGAVAPHGVRRLEGRQNAVLWDAVQRLGWDGEGALVRLIVPRSRLAAAWGAMLEATGVTAAAADVLSATLWVYLDPALTPEAETFQTLLALAHRYEGHYLLARAPASMRAEKRWWPAPPTLPLMRALKSAFDPDGVLNPGRFLV